MGKKQKQKKNNPVDNLTKEISKQCKISTKPSPAPEPTKSTEPPEPGNTVLNNEIDPELLAKWPELKLKVPPIFLHQPVDFEEHVKKILNLKIKFYQPHRGGNFTRIVCQTFSDHKYLVQYFDKKKLPYHTFGNPSKRKIKVVIRGLPCDFDFDRIKEALKSVSIPVMRVHKMQTREERSFLGLLVLVVVPSDDHGKAIFKLKELLGHVVTLEPLKNKLRQCHRCQKWGHSQRYCHGPIKCVKCAGEHLTNKCEKKADDEPTCANCKGAHTASYRKCKFIRKSRKKKAGQDKKKASQVNNKKKVLRQKMYIQRQLVTLDNYHMLYKNVNYNKKSTKV